MRKLTLILGVLLCLILTPSTAFAADTTSAITDFTKNTVNIISSIASVACVFFLIKGGFTYITSTGKPEVLEDAKKTIKNALIGLILVLGASLIVSLMQGALNPQVTETSQATLNLEQIKLATPSDGLTQVLIDAVSAFVQNLVESATKPLLDGILSYLTTTPSVLNNTVIRNFWFVMVGIVDSLFIVVVALLGLNFMSASSFGFEEMELKQLLPRIGLAFLGANVSLFLADYVILTSNTLINAVITSTGGLNKAWITQAINPETFITGNTPLITLVFLLLFLIVSIVLLFMYISRLIMVCLGAVFSPFIFLMWAMPKLSDVAEIAIKSYVATVFVTFVHVVVIQLASAFLTLPENSNNALLSIAIAIGLFMSLLKIPPMLFHMMMYQTRNSGIKKLGSQIINVMTTDNASAVSRETAKQASRIPRKVVKL